MRILAAIQRGGGRRRVWQKVVAMAGVAAMAGLLASPAQAVPSYARQTGAECAACHVGSFGPQLTPYGIKFKIGGYTDTDGKEGKIPLSAMLVANITRTAKNVSEGDKVEHYDTNNNAAVQEGSLFLAGRLADNVGAFVQSTYSGVERKWSLDQVDVRYARTLQLGGKETTLGLSLNSNPTLTDPFNTLGQWRFPYTSSDFGGGFGPSPLVESLGGSVAGANAYAFFDNSIYAELGLYNTLSKTGLNMINAGDAGRFKGLGTYGRVAYFKDMKKDNFSIGLFGFNASLQPDRGDLGTADRYRDLGIDAAYQYLGNRQHVFSVNASYVKEWQTLNYTNGVLGESDSGKGSINQFRVATSYHYNQTWGATAGLFDTRGNSDATRNGTSAAPRDGVSSLSGTPNTSGYVLQADVTPWGKEGSWLSPWANVRLGIQYTGYSRYMGGSSYLDADHNERRASDNNTTMLFLWTSI
ncbi:cytochrome C [Azonexus sp. IMCC34842]|uniref:cytochrome C n=1 Tax=Azonexus sp. IMCC34842 TaxID=3420950 RepID=UPI003D0A1EC4